MVKSPVSLLGDVQNMAVLLVFCDVWLVGFGRLELGWSRFSLVVCSWYFMGGVGFFFFCLSFFLCFINNWCPCFQVTELEALELWDILESGWEESEGERWTQHVVRWMVLLTKVDSLEWHPERALSACLNVTFRTNGMSDEIEKEGTLLGEKLLKQHDTASLWDGGNVGPVELA